MDQKPKLMTPFDMLVTSSSLYTLKLMLPFAPASMQRSLAIYIKFSELKATMEHFYGFLNTDHPGSVLEQLKSCLSPEEQTQMSQMEELMNMMEMMQTMNPVKLELIKLAAKQTEGKNGKSLAPVMMSLISSAHKKGITFSPEEMSFVLEILKDGKSKEEQAQIDRMVRMVSGYAKRAGK